MLNYSIMSLQLGVNELQEFVCIFYTINDYLKDFSCHKNNVFILFYATLNQKI